MTTCTKPTPYSNGENAHWWMVKTADYELYGPTSPSVCDNCGETRDYPNSLEYGKNDMILNIKAEKGSLSSHFRVVGLSVSASMHGVGGRSSGEGR